MRVFITGVAGFLGSHIADAFLARGDDVIGVDNLIGGDVENVPERVRWTPADCNERDVLERAMKGCDVVMHCAATAHEGLSVFSPFENAKHGYSASASVFSAAASVGVKRVVFTSSMARYGKGEKPPPFHEGMIPYPEDPYGIGKVAAEHLLANLAETHGFEHVIAVPHNIVGERQRFHDPYRNAISIFANMMLQGRQPTIYGDGSQTRSFSYVGDCVAPLVAMATEPHVVGETINIGPDREVVSVLEAARIVARVLGKPFDPHFVPPRPREVREAHCSADKAREVLGYSPRVGLEEAIERTVAWVKAKGPKPFDYHLDLEIVNDKVPETWAKRTF